MKKPAKRVMETRKSISPKKHAKIARGFRFGLHDLMAQADPEYATKREDWVKFIYLDDRHLEPRVKELVIIGILAALKSPPPHIKFHMAQAIKAGATEIEIMAAIQFAGHWGGTITQHNALEAWRLQFARDQPKVYRRLKP